MINFEELESQKHINNELIKDFDGEEKLDVNVNFIGKDILKFGRKRIILELVASLKRNNLNLKSDKICKIEKWNVRFINIVANYPLIKPQFIYYARKKQNEDLKDEGSVVLRTFRSINGVHFCSCNKCCVQNSDYNVERCLNCF